MLRVCVHRAVLKYLAVVTCIIIDCVASATRPRSHIQTRKGGKRRVSSVLVTGIRRAFVCIVWTEYVMYILARVETA